MINWEKEGILEKISHSDWASPIVTPFKKDGTIRVCADFSIGLNHQICIDKYPLPRQEELLSKLAGGEKFTVIDLSSAYLQMEVDDISKPLLTINTHRGLCCFNRMPFGLASAPAIWQRTMDTVLAGLPHVACYLDDIIITGRDSQQHLKALKSVFERLQQYGLHIKNKCQFFKEKVE